MQHFHTYLRFRLQHQPVLSPQLEAFLLACTLWQEVQQRCQFPQQAGEAALTRASGSEEPLAKEEWKESLLHSYCQSKRKTEFGGGYSMKLVLTLAGATGQCSGPCKFFPFLGEVASVFCVFDGSLITEQSLRRL